MAQRKKKAGVKKPKADIYSPAPRRVLRPAPAVAPAPAPAAEAPKVKGPGMFSSLGTSLGGAVHPVAGFLGGKLGHLVDQITGFGDYQVESNSIMTGGTPPKVVNEAVATGNTIIRHREYIGDIRATSAFAATVYPIQPGNLISFPWLAGIAANYDQYRLRGLLYEFKSTSSDALLSSSTSTALGSVCMSTQYDVLDPLFANRKEMLNHEFSCSSKPSNSFIHPVECNKKLQANNWYYIRSGTVGEIPEIDRYDYAKFTIATEGMQAVGGILGELWCTYEIELKIQKYDSNVLSDHFRLNSITNAAPLGTASGGNVTLYKSNLGGFLNGPGTAYTFPPLMNSGRFLVNYYVTGSNAVSIVAPLLTLINCEYTNLYNAAIVPYILVPENSVSTEHFVASFVVRITAPGAGIVFGGAGTLPTGTTHGDLLITQLADRVI